MYFMAKTKAPRGCRMLAPCEARATGLGNVSRLTRERARLVKRLAEIEKQLAVFGRKAAK
jgi:hypothetical protein